MSTLSGAYVRRQELTATEEELVLYGSKVLMENEILYVRMKDGTMRSKIGDGVTTVVDLPFARIFDGSVTQKLGDGAEPVSQRIVTENLVDVVNASVFDSHMKSTLIRGGYAQGNFLENNARVCTDGVFYLPFNAYISVARGYRYAIHLYNSPEPSYGTCINRDILWSYASTAPTASLPTNTYCTVTISREDDSNITIKEAQNALKFHNFVEVNEMVSVGQNDSDALDSFLKSLFVQRGIDNDGNIVIPASPLPSDSRMCLSIALKFTNKVLVNVPSTYKVAVHTFSNGDIRQSNHLTGTTWIENGDVSLPVNAYCAIVFAKKDGGSINLDEAKSIIKFYNYGDMDKALAIGQSDSLALNEFLKSLFIQCGIGEYGDLANIGTRVCLRAALKFPNTTLIDVPNGYRVTIHTYSDSEINPNNHIEGSPWITNSIVAIDSNDYVAFAVSKEDNSSITIEEAQKAFNFRVPLDEKIEDYYYTGEAINFNKHTFKIKELVSSPYFNHQGIQGFDIHNGVIAQFESDNRLFLLDLATGNKISDYECTAGHGGSLTFSNKYKASGDEFPLLYIAGCGSNGRYDPIVWVHRISRTGTALESRIKYSFANAGYWCTASFDFENKKMYLLGYTEDSYMNESGKNSMKLTVWNMSIVTNNADGTISYKLEKTIALPYVNCVQTTRFFDGNIFVLYSSTTAEDTEIHVLDPETGNVLSKFTDFPCDIKKGEAEGLTFADTEHSCQMIISVKGPDKFTYYGLTFAQSAAMREKMLAYATPQMYGAKGDGVTDDTAAIQAMLDENENVYIPGGVYMINAVNAGWGHTKEGGISPRSNTTITLAPNAVLKCIPNDSQFYNIITMERVENVTISGGKIIGDRDEHVDTGGEFGYGIGIWGCDRIRIENVEISKCWGDGIDVGASEGVTTDENNNISIDSCIIHDCRRQGISWYIGGKNNSITNCHIYNINGTAPGSGIDVEPDYTTPVDGLIIDGCTIHDTAGSSIIFSRAENCHVANCNLDMVNYWVNSKNIYIDNCVIANEVSLTGDHLFCNNSSIGSVSCSGGSGKFTNCNINAENVSGTNYALIRTTNDAGDRVAEYLIFDNCTITARGDEQYGVLWFQNRDCVERTRFTNCDFYNIKKTITLSNKTTVFNRCEFHVTADPWALFNGGDALPSITLDGCSLCCDMEGGLTYVFTAKEPFIVFRDNNLQDYQYFIFSGSGGGAGKIIAHNNYGDCWCYRTFGSYVKVINSDQFEIYESGYGIDNVHEG